MTAPALLAIYTRSGFTEGGHVGHAVVVDADGRVMHSWGNPDHAIMARSSAKPMQSTAMVRAGLDLPPDLLALASSSHSGETMHLTGAERILASAGLGVEALRTPADFPLDPVVRDAWIQAGRHPESLGMNCSGKHAAMVATCVVRGWSVGDYLNPQHPLQVAILEEVQRLTGDDIVHVGVDGCGAPVHVMTLAGLARALARAVTSDPSEPARRVVDAMRSHPLMVGGTHRDVTAFMRAVPGLVAKDGAEGVYVAALPDGRCVAVKIQDGSSRGRQVALAAILLGLVGDSASEELLALARIPMLGGGREVGAVVSPIHTS